MCPFVLLAVLFSVFIFLLELTAALTVKFSPPKLPELPESGEKFFEGNQREVYFSIDDTERSINESIYKVVSDDPNIASVKNQSYILTENRRTINGSFIVKGNFLGITKFRVVSLGEKDDYRKVVSSTYLEVRVSKLEPAVMKAFTICVAVLVSLNFINMGCAMDLNAVKSVLKKPVAPCVGFFCQYGFMPVIAYGLARLLFNDIVLQLGLFTYACSPGGGASNMWTVLLKGNLNLSLTMTFITNLAALGMVPLWLFTLGRTLFSEIKAKVPYAAIFRMLATMLVTLAIGVAFQKHLPRVARFCRRILAPASIVMILFIIVFGTYASWYMFRLFTWKIFLAATINVWLGFVFGAITSRIFNLPIEDIIAISIETGVQNTGIAFVLLQVSLLDPEKDLASVVPIAASIMTPIPLLFVYCIQLVRNKFNKKFQKEQPYVLSDDEEKRALPNPSSADPILSPTTNGYVH